MRLHLTYGRQAHELSASAETLVRDLKLKVEEVTSVWPSKQRLIYRGKVLQDDQTLADAGLPDKAKLMLMSSENASLTQVPNISCFIWTARNTSVESVDSPCFWPARVKLQLLQWPLQGHTRQHRQLRNLGDRPPQDPTSRC